MKRRWFSLCLIIVFITFASAEITVNNLTAFKDSYFLSEGLSGEINITISSEDFNSKITSNNGEEITLGELLENNGVIYSCSPPDCSKGYETNQGSTEETFNINNNTVYAGLVIEGNNIQITNLRLDLSSNFSRSKYNPLKIEFFEGSEWRFNQFSEEYLIKNWGCYLGQNLSIGPYIKTASYCEMIPISETGKLKVGASVNGSEVVEGGNGELRMVLYGGAGSIGDCIFNPKLGEEECKIGSEDGSIFPSGDYQICVEAPKETNYKIYTESSGENCGFVLEQGSQNSTKDYAIFAQTAKYENATNLNSETINFQDAIDSVNSIIQKRYGGNCPDTCILPIKISGNSQDLKITNVTLNYQKNGEDHKEESIYKLNEIPSKVDFNGILDLSLTGFKISESGTYKISLGSEILLEKEVNLVPAPIINSIYPKNPPAGVPIIYYVDVEFNPNKSLNYKWNFGDGNSKETEENFVMHTYDEIKNYTLEIEVSAGFNYSSKKNFQIVAISPEEAIGVGLTQKNSLIKEVVNLINSYPSWYREEIRKKIEPDRYVGELRKIEDERGLALLDKDFLEIAKKLYTLIVPSSIFSEEKKGFILLTTLDQINPSPVLNFAGGSEENLEKYKDPILRWQNQNIDSNIQTISYKLQLENLEVSDILRYYSIDITSYDSEESYFVISKSIDDLFFKGDIKAYREEDYTIIVIGPEEEKSFEFYLFGAEEVSLFVSPKLNTLVLEADIVPCNYNLVCEKDLGETYKTCRNDCKPITRSIIYGILVLFFFLLAYTLLQIWYKRHYEKFLFGDRRHLYNLLMFISNAHSRGINDNQIKKDLKKQGWSGERINYILKKSKGKSAGLPEIIPIEKIITYFRNKKSKKNTTPIQQQFRRNINKSGFQQNIR
tara:strand:- start:2877 stop:5552 length:2676 start_codon:yes stop_codon:yes gene_type:complete